jgi:hypothetical protein
MLRLGRLIPDAAAGIPDAGWPPDASLDVLLGLREPVPVAPLGLVDESLAGLPRPPKALAVELDGDNEPAPTAASDGLGGRPALLGEDRPEAVPEPVGGGAEPEAVLHPEGGTLETVADVVVPVDEPAEPGLPSAGAEPADPPDTTASVRAAPEVTSSLGPVVAAEPGAAEPVAALIVGLGPVDDELEPRPPSTGADGPPA